MWIITIQGDRYNNSALAEGHGNQESDLRSGHCGVNRNLTGIEQDKASNDGTGYTKAHECIHTMEY